MAYDLEQIRRLVTDAFNSGEVKTLAFDKFQDVYDDFSSGMSKSEMVKAVVEHADKYGGLDTMLAYIQQENPYQYGRYADKLIAKEDKQEESKDVTTPSPSNGRASANAKRLTALQGHIDREAELLDEYREELSYEDDPRRLKKIKREIKRQKDTIEGYQQEAAEIQATMGGTATVESDSKLEQAQLDKIVETLEQVVQTQAQISGQISETESNLTSGQKQIRNDIGQLKAAILDKIDEQHKNTVDTLLGQMNADQIELTDLMYDAIDQNQLTLEEIDQLHKLGQQAAVDMKRLRAGQLDGTQWADLVKSLQDETSLSQKLHLTIPIIPTVLKYEAELAVDVMPSLKQAWQTTVSRVRKWKSGE